MFQITLENLLENELGRWKGMIESVLEHEARVLGGCWSTDPNHALYTLRLPTAAVDCTIYIDTEFFPKNTFIIYGCAVFCGENETSKKRVWRPLINPTEEELKKKIEDSYNLYERLFRNVDAAGGGN